MSELKITGYRDLSFEEVEAINYCKHIGEQVSALCDYVDGTDGVDKRWVAIARTDLQKGFMALVRAISRPTTF
jgi:hypothetical protein